MKEVNTMTMTTFAALALMSSLSVSVHAQERNCSDDLCVGTDVITNANVLGTVDAILPGDDVLVRLADGGARSYASWELARTRGCSKDLCVGSRVIAPPDAGGTVGGVFPTGEVVVFLSEGGRRTYPRSRLARTKGCSQVFCVGDAVVNDSGSGGQVAGIFMDGQVVVLFHNGDRRVYYFWQLERQ